MNIHLQYFLRKGLLTLGLCACLPAIGCAPARPPVPPGVVPEQQLVAAADEQYGHEVLSMLVEKYPLDQDDARIARVRNIVDQLTRSIPGTGDQWHVYVMKDESVKNAAATRGNYIFVWTGMLRQVQSDAELAAILAHEIGHVLAGHTQPSPAEEVNEIISGVAGTVAREVVAAQGPWGLASDLAEILTKTAISAVLINPSSQRNELEADQIGLYLMADAGYNPDEAVQFWERVKTDPEFSGFTLQFLSSHPSSEERLNGLKANLPGARDRYQKRIDPSAPGVDRRSEWVQSSTKASAPSPQAPPGPSSKNKPTPQSSLNSDPQTFIPAPTHHGLEHWIVVDSKVQVFEQPSRSSKVLQVLSPQTEVTVIQKLTLTNREHWLRIETPINGYVLSRALAPRTP